MQHDAESIGETAAAPSERGRGSGTPGLVRALKAQLTRSREPLEVSLDHEDYTGRNVLSITLRDDDDVAEAPVYYEQRVFTRFRRAARGDDGAGRPAG